MLTISATRWTRCTTKAADPSIPCNRQGGFTLLDALIAVALMALLARAALPAWQAQQAQQRLELAASGLQRAVWLAQLHAAQRQRPVTLRALPTSACVAAPAPGPTGSHAWLCGWAITQDDTNPPWQQASWPVGVQVSSNRGTFVTFAPSGQTRQWQSLRLTAKHAPTAWRATVSVLGRMRIAPHTP